MTLTPMECLQYDLRWARVDQERAEDRARTAVRWAKVAIGGSLLVVAAAIISILPRCA